MMTVASDDIQAEDRILKYRTRKEATDLPINGQSTTDRKSHLVMLRTDLRSAFWTGHDLKNVKRP
jgi:ribosomal protein S13